MTSEVTIPSEQLMGRLEMIDGKVSYTRSASRCPADDSTAMVCHVAASPAAKLTTGSNMKYYFRKWQESDTEDNFFRW